MAETDFSGKQAAGIAVQGSELNVSLLQDDGTGVVRNNILDATVASLAIAQAGTDTRPRHWSAKRIADSVTGNAAVIANTAKVSDVNHVAALLPNVNNTSDLAKPISTLTQSALDTKLATTQKAAASGLASLDAASEVVQAQAGAAAQVAAGLGLSSKRADGTWVDTPSTAALTALKKRFLILPPRQSLDSVLPILTFARWWWGNGNILITIRELYYGPTSAYGEFLIDGHTINGGVVSVVTKSFNGPLPTLTVAMDTVKMSATISASILAYQIYEITVDCIGFQAVASTAAGVGGSSVNTLAAHSYFVHNGVVTI